MRTRLNLLNRSRAPINRVSRSINGRCRTTMAKGSLRSDRKYSCLTAGDQLTRQA